MVSFGVYFKHPLLVLKSSANLSFGVHFLGSLPLRFWSNAIKNPDYIFDIRPTRAVEASMDVIGQLFHDVHDTKTHKLGQVTEKLLTYPFLSLFFFKEKFVHYVPEFETVENREVFHKLLVHFSGCFCSFCFPLKSHRLCA